MSAVRVLAARSTHRPMPALFDWSSLRYPWPRVAMLGSRGPANRSEALNPQFVRAAGDVHATCMRCRTEGSSARRKPWRALRRRTGSLPLDGGTSAARVIRSARRPDGTLPHLPHRSTTRFTPPGRCDRRQVFWLVFSVLFVQASPQPPSSGWTLRPARLDARRRTVKEVPRSSEPRCKAWFPTVSRRHRDGGSGSTGSRFLV